MNDSEILISENLPKDFAIRTWVNDVKNNKTLFTQRQAVAIFLTAIGLDDNLSKDLVLKGGTLMSMAFKSDRATGDVDLTADYEPSETVNWFENELNNLMRRSSASLGYSNLICRVQTVKKLPKPDGFPQKFSTPALSVTIAYAEQGSKVEERLIEGKSPTVISVDVSFKELIFQKNEFFLNHAGIKISSYSIEDVIAEKIRATIQQTNRDHVRNRRQDIYDIDFLIKNQPMDDGLKLSIIKALCIKCESRNLVIDQSTLDDDEIRNASKKDWETISLEVSHLPDFDDSYDRVLKFYKSLPWEAYGN